MSSFWSSSLFFLCFFSFLFAGNLEKAGRLFKEKKYPEAQKIYQEVLDKDPENQTALLYLGRIFLQKGNSLAAEEFLSRCLQKNPDNVDAKLFLGQALYNQGQYLQAERLWKEVIEQAPRYVDAYIALSRLYLRIDEPEKAKKMIQRAEAIYPDDSQLLILSAQNLQAKQLYKEALCKFLKASERGDFFSVLPSLTILRPYVYPTLSAKGYYDREIEQDLVLKIDTTKIKTYGTFFLLNIPIANYCSLYGGYTYLPYNQINLLQKRSNFNVNTEKAGGGIHLYFQGIYDIYLEGFHVQGKGVSQVIFPFKNQSLWEPRFLVSIHPSNHLFSFAAYKTEFIARNFPNTFSYFVKQNRVDLAYEYRFLPRFYKIGFSGSQSWYKAAVVNKKREASFWLRFKGPRILRDLIHLRYEAKIGGFSFVDEDYFSYRRKWEQRAKLILLYEWADRGSLEASYEYSWQKVKNFNNINESITSSNPPSPQLLARNFIKGDTYQITAKKSIGSHFHFQAKGKAYFDDDHYRAYTIEASLKGTF